MAKKKLSPLGRDIGTIVLSVFVAIFIVESGIIHRVLASSESHIIGSFIAGIFFTSVFTVAPATVVLFEIAGSNSIFIVAIFGAIGALLGDLIIFRFVHEHLAADLMEFLKERRHKRLALLFRSRLYRRLVPFLGALVIASPLPDEIGLVMLGASHVKTPMFVAISLIFNFLGILAIGLVAKAVLQ